MSEYEEEKVGELDIPQESSKGEGLSASESKKKKQLKQFLNDKNADDIKKIEQYNAKLHKEVKILKLQIKRTPYNQEDIDVEMTEDTEKTYTLQNTDNLMDDEMNTTKYLERCFMTKFELNDYDNILELIDSKDNRKALLGVVGIKKLLLSQANHTEIHKDLSTNLIPKLLNFAGKNDSYDLQLESMRCLTNIASEMEGCGRILYENGAIDTFKDLLHSQHDEIKGLAAWHFANLIDEQPELHKIIVSKIDIESLIFMLSHSPPDSMCVKNAAWCFKNLLRRDLSVSKEMINDAFAAYCKVICESTDICTLTDSLFGLVYLKEPREAPEAVFSKEVCDRIMSLIHSEDDEIIYPAIRAFGLLLFQKSISNQIDIDSGMVQTLSSLLDHTNEVIRKETCWAINRICITLYQHIPIIIESDILEKLITLAKTDEYEIQIEAGWCLAMAASFSDEAIITQIVDKGGIEAIVHVLYQQIDATTCRILLDGIKSILEVSHEYPQDHEKANQFTQILVNCGGVKLIQKLQYHENEYVHENAINILTMCFKLEEGEGDPDEPNTNF